MDALDAFNAKYRRKKLINIALSCVTVLMGVFAVVYIFHHDNEGLLTFRWLTVDGTVLTTVLTAIVVVVNIVEFERYTEVTKSFVYMIRLSCAVTEGIIFLVVMISQLPFFSDHMHILRPDMMLMHVIIPVLTIISFIYNDSPLGKFRFRWVFSGNAFAFIYALTVFSLIVTDRMSEETIPYFFMDIRRTGIVFVLSCFAIIFGIGTGLSYALVELNRRVYWRTLSIKNTVELFPS